MYCYVIELKPDLSVLLDYSLTVKAATLIFISGRVQLFHLLNKGNQVLVQSFLPKDTLLRTYLFIIL